MGVTHPRAKIVLCVLYARDINASKFSDSESLK